MRLFNFLVKILKGENHDGRIEERVSGRHGHERRIIHTFASVRERAVSDIRGIGMLASACADERGRDTGSVSSDQVRGESSILIAAAKGTGCFMETASVPGTRYTIRTGESEVRLVQKEQLYYKIKNPFAKLHLKKHPPEYVLFEHIVHNILFPDCRLEFLGVAEDLHEARLVFRQQAVRADTRPDDRQIAEYLGWLGLQPEGRYSFANDYVFVTDVGQDGDNVLMDDDQHLRFIDPIIGFKQPLLAKLSSLSSLGNDGINELVFDLYGLTPDEREIVKGDGKAS